MTSDSVLLQELFRSITVTQLVPSLTCFREGRPNAGACQRILGGQEDGVGNLTSRRDKIVGEDTVT